MRKQYFFRKSDAGLQAWDVDRLVELSDGLPVRRVSLTDLREVDEPLTASDETPSWDSLLEHKRLIEEADLSYPIILSASGEVMDGRHRIAKAALNGASEILAVRFPADPEPDYLGKGPDDLPYD
jgi:hypothetical protein